MPLKHAYQPGEDERLIPEFVLQLKRGSLAPPYFESRYGSDVLKRFREPLGALKETGYLMSMTPRAITLSGQGLLRVDSLLPGFFLPECSGIRYT